MTLSSTFGQYLSNDLECTRPGCTGRPIFEIEMVTMSVWDRMYSPRKEIVLFSERHEIFSNIQSKCLHRLTELLVYIHDSQGQHIRRKQVGILDKGAN